MKITPVSFRDITIFTLLSDNQVALSEMICQSTGLPEEKIAPFLHLDTEKLRQALFITNFSLTHEERMRGYFQSLMLGEHMSTHQENLARKVHNDFLLPQHQVLEIIEAKSFQDRSDRINISKSLTKAIIDGPILAAFTLSVMPDGSIAASTRPDDGKVGLPGGKLDAHETAPMAAIRETFEEGWAIEGIDENVFYVEDMGKYRCGWYHGIGTPVMLDEYKEKHRITNLCTNAQDLAAGGLGNDNALKKIGMILQG